jgi:ketosteroid isomerase-like protein
MTNPIPTSGAADATATDITVDDIATAAQAIVDAFAATDEADYFGRFAPDCSFAFHTDGVIHTERDAWQQGWRELRADGWEVLECHSLVTHIQLIPEGGIFVHELETTARTGDDTETYRERETIVFTRRDGELVAVHEHLSTIDDTAADTQTDASEAAA